MSDIPLVTISILGYNDAETIGEAIRSAALQRYPNLELIVADNASPDSEAAFREDALKKAIVERKRKLGLHCPFRFTRNSKNLGFARGHNEAIRTSRGAFVLLLNSDAILDDRFVERAVRIFAKDARIASLQGKLLRYDVKNHTPATFTADGTRRGIIDTTGLVVLKNRRIINRGQGEADAGQFNRKEEVFGADGAAPVYRRTALEDAKICLGNHCEYFDEDFFSYKEDVDLAWRLRLYGWKTLYVPDMVAWHARTAGESAARSYLKIIKERRKIAGLPKFWSFRNQRLMQIKNELLSLFLKNLPQLTAKEFGSWAYLALFERQTLRVAKDLLVKLPRAYRKRRIIMKNRRAGAAEMAKWFT